MMLVKHWQQNSDESLMPPTVFLNISIAKIHAYSALIIYKLCHITTVYCISCCNIFWYWVKIFASKNEFNSTKSPNKNNVFDICQSSQLPL